MIETELQFRVRYAETDQMRFAHHSNYIVWFEMGRIGLMSRLGFLYAKLEEDGYLLPVIEVNAHYFKPARFDDLLTLKTTISEKPAAKIRFEYQIINDQNQLLCSGYSLHSFMNKQDRAIRPPRNFLTKLQGYF